jgi:RNA polymerase sigma factor (sigma-70 family)
LTLIRSLTPPDTDNEGVAQEVFLAAFRSLASFEPKRSAFSTRLFTITRNRCRNKLARRRPVVGALLPDVVDPRSPARAASEAERFRQLAAALVALPFEQRSAFVAEVSMRLYLLAAKEKPPGCLRGRDSSGKLICPI